MKFSWVNFKVRLRPDISILLFVCCVLLIFGSWLVVGIQLEMEYINTVRKIHSENANLAKVVAEHFGLIIDGVEDRLVILKEELEREGTVPPVAGHIFTRITAKQIVNHMIISGPEGTVIASAVKTPPDFHVADREYFTVHRDTASDRLHIGKPVADRTLKKLAIPISRRINKPDGSFGGVVAGLITIDSFGDFYRQMERYDEKNIIVVGLDGITRLQIHGDQISAGLDISREALFRLIGQQALNLYLNENTLDNQQQFVSYRTMPEYPLFVIVDTPAEQALSSYYQHRRWYLTLLVCFNLVVLWSGILLTRKINRLEQTQMKLAISEERYRTIIDSVNDGIIMQDAKTGDILEVNKKVCDFHGYTREEMISKGLRDLCTGESPYSEVEAKQRLLIAAGGEAQFFEWQVRNRQGYNRWMEVSLKNMEINNDNRIVAVVRDISVRKLQEEQIWRIAYSDTLTGLPNRACLKEFLEKELTKARQNEASGAVFFVDMDGLKMVNDHFGHSYGDNVIKIAGEFISKAAGEGAIISRIGGDEFIIMLPDQNDRKQIAQIAENMIKQLSRDYKIGESSVYMSASIGIALYPKDASTAEDVLQKADLAMYTAKSAGGNMWRFYDESMEKASREKLLLKHGLRGAIERGELSLQYQPIIPTCEGGVISFEALLRWTSLEHGSVPPGRFIPLAEESETILKIGKWVLEEAVRFIRKLSDMGKDEIKVWVNVSPRQLVAEDFVVLVQSIINNAGIRPNQLGIEITENALITSLTDSTEKLNELRKIGIDLSIDDFGTGYSSLTYLKNLPVQTIKIDKSFICDIVSDEAQLRFVQCIFDLAHVLDLTVVAEGVETEEQLETLMQSKCDYIQGYIISRPISEGAAIRYLIHR